ncbi:MAG: hypothetical protein MI861_11770 [Pirellulales bacterium]|nr:hypothetical protein [Pirellulales bacterium]
MSRYQSIRTALTLSLIVAMMIQPLAVGASGIAPLQRPADDPLTCAGCGCCQVDRPQQACCCCDPGDFADASESGQPSDAKSMTPEFARPCLCGISLPPLHRGSKSNLTTRLTEARNVRYVLRPLDLARAEGLTVWPAASGIDLGHLDRFSQRFLCIWRI